VPRLPIWKPPKLGRRLRTSEFETARKELLETCERYEKRLADLERTYAAHLAELNQRIETTEAARDSARAEAERLRGGRTSPPGPCPGP
jgi:chromosome segregation ATPase